MYSMPVAAGDRGSPGDPSVVAAVDLINNLTEIISAAQEEAHHEGFQAGLTASWLNHEATHKELGFPEGFHPSCNSCKEVAALQAKARAEERAANIIAVCRWCREGKPLVESPWDLDGGATYHLDDPDKMVYPHCPAAAILERWET